MQAVGIESTVANTTVLGRQDRRGLSSACGTNGRQCSTLPLACCAVSVHQGTLIGDECYALGLLLTLKCDRNRAAQVWKSHCINIDRRNISHSIVVARLMRIGRWSGPQHHSSSFSIFTLLAENNIKLGYNIGRTEFTSEKLEVSSEVGRDTIGCVRNCKGAFAKASYSISVWNRMSGSITAPCLPVSERASRATRRRGAIAVGRGAGARVEVARRRAINGDSGKERFADLTEAIKDERSISGTIEDERPARQRMLDRNNRWRLDKNRKLASEKANRKEAAEEKPTVPRPGRTKTHSMPGGGSAASPVAGS